MVGYLSGVPVLWDDEDEEQLFRRLVSEAADPAHIWHLPRGGHPEASQTSVQQWRELHELFTSSLTLDRDNATGTLIAYAESRGLKREDEYLHNIPGVDDKSQLCQYIACGRLESLGRRIRRQFGVRRALCVDNGGSIELRFYPCGSGGFPVQLFAAPNFRPAGMAYLAIVLPDHSSFVLLPDSLSDFRWNGVSCSDTLGRYIFNVSQLSPLFAAICCDTPWRH